MRGLSAAFFALGAVACATAGSTWVNQPLDGSEEGMYEPLLEEEGQAPPPPPPATTAPPSRRLGAVASDPGGESLPAVHTLEREGRKADVVGRTLGTFRNTYYDFPSELDFEGGTVALHNPRCETIASVRRGFFEAVCVQGSGTLGQGATVSFSKRDCECAEICPRTNQKICFDALDPKQYPWGRGATGKPITPLLTVAVDDAVIPLGTPLYVPEFDGLPRDATESASHDGCFIAQDRGLKVKGKHVDFFTGHRSMTELWNRLVPSNRGVTVVVDAPRCARAN